MTSENKLDEKVVPSQYTIRILLIVTAFLAILAAWGADRHFLSRELDETKQELATAEKLVDYHKRKFMTRRIIGRSVSEFPEMAMLADLVAGPDHEFFRWMLDFITAPNVQESCENCKIYFFDIHGGNAEGDPGEFYLLSKDGVIADLRLGETLQL